MKFSELPTVTGGEIVAFDQDKSISNLITDSRKLVLHEGSVFFAIAGERNDGHEFIESLYESGIRQFVIEKDYPVGNFAGTNILKVASSLEAIQQVATHHRQKFSIPVIGITGSNGKTIIKEWLHQLLSPDYNVIKNPGSYNSQLGVPLSVWQIKPHHQLGIFEAGISKENEMQNLQKIIAPTIGVLTTIGSAHDENFPNRLTKITEKLKLFNQVNTLIYCSDQREIHDAIKLSGIPSLAWGKQNADVLVLGAGNSNRIMWKEIDFTVDFPFTDKASIENALHCVATMLVLGCSHQVIQKRVQMLRSVPMRLELKDGINQCLVIDDSYNNDLGGLQISLDFLKHQHQKKSKSFILSDILQSGLQDEVLAQHIATLVNSSGIFKFIGIGPILHKHKKLFTIPAFFFESTDDFLNSSVSKNFQNETVLVKGGRIFAFERVVKQLEKKVHGTIMEVNLGAVVHNLNFFKSKILPRTKLMVMVKAFAYGSGSIEIANILQYHHVDYLGVAYADEGVELRQNNISIPIMVMNPSPDGFQSMLNYNLEPEIYSFKILQDLISFLDGRNVFVHLKLDTGMHRLGFEEDDIDALINLLKKHPNLKVVSVFSHLAGSDDMEHDAFSKSQVQKFQEIANRITTALAITPILHILNTPGILRLPEFQFDMVRLGIGLYGVDPTLTGQNIKPVATLKTIISQIRNVKKNDSIGYGRKGIAKKDLIVATIAIGYADGFSRAFSNGVGEVLVRGVRVPILGSVCMDMTMIDISGIEVEEGDEVIIFGNGLPIQEVAEKINTIPYEVLTNTSERIKRVFVAEGI